MFLEDTFPSPSSLRSKHKVSNTLQIFLKMMLPLMFFSCFSCSMPLLGLFEISCSRQMVSVTLRSQKNLPASFMFTWWRRCVSLLARSRKKQLFFDNWEDVCLLLISFLPFYFFFQSDLFQWCCWGLPSWNPTAFFSAPTFCQRSTANRELSAGCFILWRGKQINKATNLEFKKSLHSMFYGQILP